MADFAIGDWSLFLSNFGEILSVVLMHVVIFIHRFLCQVRFSKERCKRKVGSYKLMIFLAIFSFSLSIRSSSSLRCTKWIVFLLYSTWFVEWDLIRALPRASVAVCGSSPAPRVCGGCLGLSSDMLFNDEFTALGPLDVWIETSFFKNFWF